MKLNNNARAIIFDNPILMSKLCDILLLSPADIKFNGYENRLLEPEPLTLITEHTKLSVQQLTEKQ